MSRLRTERSRATARLSVGALAAALLGTLAPAIAQEGAPLPAFADIAPVAWLVGEIGGDAVSVEALIAPGQDPHTYEPSARTLARVSAARLLFVVDLPFEREITRRIQSQPGGPQVVDVAAGIAREGHPGGHQHEPDPHVWLSPPMLRVMAANVAAALAQARPDEAARFAANLGVFRERLDALDARLAKLLAPLRGRSFYVFHPAFGYFGEAYGLHQQAVEVEGKSPTPRELAAMIRAAQDEGVRVIFVQPQFDQTVGRHMAASIGGAVVPLDPLAPDVFANLQAIADRITEALGPPAGEQR